MDIDFIRQITKPLNGVTEDIKWGNDLCFCVSMMFCVTGLDATSGASMKVTEEEFHELTSREGIIPAPYLARNMWVYVESPTALNKKEWEYYITQSYQLVASKLTKKVRKELGIE